MVSAAASAPRDDGNLRSLSNNERLFVRNCASSASTTPNKGIHRLDGRHMHQYRTINFSFGRSNTSSSRAECTVQLGDAHSSGGSSGSSCTRVVTVITCDLLPPSNPDVRPNDGLIKVTVNVSPMAFPSALDHSEGTDGVALTTGGGGAEDEATGGGGATSGIPSTTRITRFLERLLKDSSSSVLDVESLCVVGGSWVWRLNLDVAILDHGGNILDAAMLSTMGALRHFRLPHVTVEDEGSTGARPIVWRGEEREPTPLPLHHSPISITLGLLQSLDSSSGRRATIAMVDPTQREELCLDATITHAYNKYGEVCGVDLPGALDCEMSMPSMMECARLAQTKAVELCGLLERALEEAEKKAVKEREERLLRLAQLQANASSSKKEEEVVVEQEDTAPEQEEEAEQESSQGEKQREERERQERYKKRALDYNCGHFAAQAKSHEEKLQPKPRKVQKNVVLVGGKGSSSLVDAMIQSAQQPQGDQLGHSKTNNEKEEILERNSPKEEQTTKKTNEEMTKAGISSLKETKDDKDDEEEDEEDATTMLTSEFQTAVAVAPPTQAQPPLSAKKHEDKETEAETKTKTKTKTPAPKDEIKEQEDNKEDDDVDDLAMAIVSKKKKDKKKKKKKK